MEMTDFQNLVTSSGVDLDQLQEEIKEIVEKVIYGQRSHRRLYPDVYSTEVASAIMAILTGADYELIMEEEDLG
jgi:hypothetical protein